MGLETATIIAIVSAVVSVGTAIYAMNQASDETNAGTAVTKQGSQNSRNKVYGKAIVGTTRVYSNVKDRDQSYRTDVFDVAGIGTLRFHNVWIEDKKMFETDKSILTYPLSATNGTFDSSFMRDTYKKSEEFKVQFRSGHENQVAANLARLNSDGEWTSAHKGANVPHIVVYADYTADQDYVMFSDNYNVKVLVSSEDLYDPRTGQFNGDSSNPALAIRDYLTSSYYGLSITQDYIDDQSIIEAANLCEFYGLEINTAIDGGASFSDVLNDMLSTFGGALTIHQGKIQILFEDSVDAPLYEFNSDNILKGSFTVTPTSSSGYCNVVTTTFKSQINGEKSDDYVIPADTSNDPRVLEDGFIQSKTFDMPYTVDAYEEDNGVVSKAVKFRANREYKRALFQTTCSFDVDLLEYPLLNIWSVISLSDPIYGFENKLFRVQSMVSSTDEKGLNIATLTLIEYDDSVYLTDIDGSSVSTPLPIRSDVISPPTNIAFNVESFVKNGYGVLKWYAGSYTGTTGYDVEYRISTEDNVNPWVRVVSGYSKESYDVYGLKNSSYDFRVRTNDRVLGTSVWVELTSQEVSNPYTLPSVTNLTVDASSKDFILSWDDMSSTAITNKTDDNNPNAADSTGTLSDVLSHYLIKVYSGTELKGTFTTSESSFSYTYKQNSSSTLSRTLDFQVSIVDLLGNISTASAVNGSNTQEDKPVNVTVTNTNGNSTIEWLPVLSPDYSGTYIYVDTTEDFTPSEANKVATLGQESFYVYNYDPSNITDRYVRIAHFDSFDSTSLKYSDSKLLEYVSLNESVYYYIKPTKGTAIKNGVGSLDLEAHKVTMGVDEVITEGTVQLFIGTTEGGYTKTFDKDAITGSTVVTLKDGVNGSVLDSITLVDVTDGNVGSHAVYGSVSSSGTLTWVQAPETALNTAGVWSPTSTTVDIVATYYEEGISVATKTVPVTRSDAGLLTVGDYTGDEDVTVVVSGGSTPALSIEFTYDNVKVTENLAAIVGAKHGDKGTKGDTGKGVKTQFSVNGTSSWHDSPAATDEYIRTCTNTNGGAWTCGGATKIKGNTGNGVKTQFSADSSAWHDAPATGDKYIRTCTNSNGGTWSCSGSTLIKGETGVKGAKHYFVSGTEWSDTTASNYVKVSQGDDLVSWDIVTIYSADDAFSVSKYWDGDSWEAVSEVIDGNLIVNGTVRASSIDVDDLFAQDITATGSITGGNFVGGKLEVTSESTSTRVTIDASSDSPIVVNDGTNDVLRFDASKKLQLSGGLADSTIDNLNMFSPAIWDQIKAPLSEGSTGGAFSGESVTGGSTLTSKVTMTNVNVNAIALACRFSNNIFEDQPATPQWSLTVTARVRAVSGEGNYGSVQNIHSQTYTGTSIVRDDTAFININYADTATLTGVVAGGDIEVTFTASKVAGSIGNGRLTSLSASQAVAGGGQAGAATLLDGQSGTYYLNYNNFTNTPTIPVNTWRPLGTTATTAAKGDHVHAWSTITGKPTTFAPSSHSHEWSTITGKPTTFAPSSHSHTEYAASSHSHSGYLTTTGNAASATKLNSILTTFNGEYPITVNVNGTIYSHTGMKFKGADSSLTIAGQVNATGGNSGNWNTAYGWGNHGSAGYLTSVPSEYLTQTEGDGRYALPSSVVQTIYQKEMNTTSAGYVSFEFTGYVNTIGRDYYIFDVIGYKDFRDAESFVHYTVYLNCKGAFGGTLADNTITADVVARNQSADANLTFKLERNLSPNNTHKLWIGIDEGYSGIQILHYPTYIGDLTRVSASSFAFTSTEPTTTTVFPPSIPLLSTGGTMTGNLTLNSATPQILFNGTSDVGVDMAIKATPEGLDFYEPEDNNKVHFQILDDTGVNSPFGYKVGGVRKDLNWDTAYGWGDHGGAGYLTSLPSHSHAWSTITGKPTTFAPSSHSHAWSTITGKPTTFAPSSHSHSEYMPVLRSVDSSSDTFGTYILAKDDGGYLGSRPSGSHNGVGMLTMHTHSGNYYTQLALDTSQNQLWLRSANNASTFGAWAEVWASNNDGSGSGLDADLLDGQQGSYYAQASHSHSYLPLSGGTLTGGLSISGYNTFSTYAGNFNFLTMNSGTVWGLTNDGSGSGLDADLLDGQHGSYYAPASHNHSLTLSGDVSGSGSVSGTISVTVNNDSHSHSNYMPIRNSTPYTSPTTTTWGSFNLGNGTMMRANGTGRPSGSTHGYWFVGGKRDTAGGYAGLYFNHYSGANGLFVGGHTDGSSAPNWERVWTSNTDGSGSGLDADLLDGQHASAFALAHSHPYLPTAGGTVTGNLAVNGTTTLGNGNGDVTNINDVLNIQSTDSGDAHLFFGESSSGGYGSYWNWDSSYTHTWYSRNAGTNSSLMSHDTRYTHKFRVNRGIERVGHSNGYFIGSYNSTGANDAKTNPIYTIGDSYRPTDTSFGNMYGIGYAHNNIWGGGKSNGWGLYVTEAGRVFCTISSTGLWHEDIGAVWGSSNDGSGSGLDADLLDGKHASEFALAHSHPYLPIAGKAADSDKLDGLDSSEFARADYINSNYKDFTVNGDANTYYPVSISEGGHYGFHTYSISRGYSWTAPTTWNTSSHKGGLTFTFQNCGDGAWGGNDKSIRVLQFAETYSTMVGGIGLSTGGAAGGGVIVWLRGGGAQYRFHSPNGSKATATVHLTSVTASNGTVYAPRSYSSSTVQAEVYSRYPVRGTGSFYSGNNLVWHAGNDGSNSGLDADLLDGQHGSYYAPASHSHSNYVEKNVGYTWTGTGNSALSFRSLDTMDTASGDQAALEVYQDTAGADAFMQFHVSGDFAKYFGLHGGVNDFGVSGWSNGATFQRMFHDGYHPNADKWTTARVLTLTGDVSGTVTWDGSANASMLVVVGDNSHSHSNYLTTTGKAADSNLLDGIDSGSFLRSDATDYLNGVMYVRADIRNENAYRDHGVYGHYDSTKTNHIWSMGSGYRNSTDGSTFGNLYGLAYKHTNNATGGTMGGSHQMVWCNNGSPRGSIGYDRVWHASGMRVGSSDVWHGGNDGSGSGLDADLLDGIDSSRVIYGSNSNKTNNTGSASADLPSGFYDQHKGDMPTSTYYSYINMRHTNESNHHGAQIAVSFYSPDLYTRHYQGGNSTGNGSFSGWDKHWRAGNDGSGSGLDADLLDGQHGSYYAPASHSHSYLPLTGGTLTGGLSISGYNTFSSYAGNFAFLTLNNSTVWGLTNDGSGSGLDADLLDGQQGSYYAPASHSHSYLPLSGGSLTGNLNLPRANAITFYGNGSNDHSIMSRSWTGAMTDDIRINSYGGITLNLDSNNNNSSGKGLILGRHGSSTGSVQKFIEVAGETCWTQMYDTSSGTGFTYMSFKNAAGSTTYGSIYRSYSSMTYATSSDYRLKENVVDLTGASERLKQVPVKRFNFIEHPERTVDGFIAHEVQEIVPEAVVGDKDALDEEGNPVYQGVDQSKLVPLLVASLQEALAEIDNLKARVSALEN